MKKLLLFASLCFLFTTVANAQQTTFSKVINDGPLQVVGYSVIKCFDNNYMLAGIDEGAALVLKLDTSGNIIWKKTIGNNNGGVFTGIIPTKDSDYVLAGSIFNTVNSSNDFLCVKINSAGDTLWTKEIDMGYNDYALSVQQTYDNGYILAGYAGQNSPVTSKIAVVKLDSSGNLLWGKKFTGGNFDNCAYSIRQTPDSGYMMLGYTDSLSNYDTRTILMKITSDGNIVWTKKDHSAYYSTGYDMALTANGIACYLVSSMYNIILKTDFAGNVAWCKTYGGNGNYYNSPAPKIHPASDSGFVFLSDMSLQKIDSAGNPVWSKSWMCISTTDVVESGDKGYLILLNGPLMVTKSPIVTWGEIALIKTDSSGNCATCFMGNSTHTPTTYPINFIPVSFTTVTGAANIISHPVVAAASLNERSGCVDVIGGMNESETNENAIAIYPDPTYDHLSVECSSPSTIEILNIRGQLLKIIPTGETKTILDVSFLTCGVYIVEVKTEKGIKIKKFVKE